MYGWGFDLLNIFVSKDKIVRLNGKNGTMFLAPNDYVDIYTPEEFHAAKKERLELINAHAAKYGGRQMTYEEFRFA